MTIRAFDEYHPQVASSAYVDDSALVVGKVDIGPDSSIWPFCVIRGDVHQITIGSRSNIQDNCVVHVSHDSYYQPGGAATTIGDDVTVGHMVILHGCTIGNRCLIGMGSIIMDHVVVEDETIIGAGTLITEGKVLESGFVWMGRPARRVRPITADERQRLSYSAQHYVKLKNQHITTR